MVVVIVWCCLVFSEVWCMNWWCMWSSVLYMSMLQSMVVRMRKELKFVYMQEKVVFVVMLVVQLMKYQVFGYCSCELLRFMLGSVQKSILDMQMVKSVRFVSCLFIQWLQKQVWLMVRQCLIFMVQMMLRLERLKKSRMKVLYLYSVLFLGYLFFMYVVMVIGFISNVFRRLVIVSLYINVQKVVFFCFLCDLYSIMMVIRLFIILKMNIIVGMVIGFLGRLELVIEEVVVLVFGVDMMVVGGMQFWSVRLGLGMVGER